MSERTSSEWTYTQPMSVLDWAWDAYMELSLKPAPDGAPGMADLIHMKVPPVVLSRLFDIAITAYRAHTEDTSDGQRTEDHDR